MTDEITQNDCQGEGPEFVERAEIASLREQLTEAREIIGELESELVKAARTAVEIARDEGLTINAMVLEAAIVSPGEESVIARARAFLNKEKADG